MVYIFNRKVEMFFEEMMGIDIMLCFLKEVMVSCLFVIFYDLWYVFVMLLDFCYKVFLFMEEEME